MGLYIYIWPSIGGAWAGRGGDVPAFTLSIFPPPPQPPLGGGGDPPPNGKSPNPPLGGGGTPPLRVYPPSRPPPRGMGLKLYMDAPDPPKSKKYIRLRRTDAARQSRSFREMLYNKGWTVSSLLVLVRKSSLRVVEPLSC